MKGKIFLTLILIGSLLLVSCNNTTAEETSPEIVNLGEVVTEGDITSSILDHNHDEEKIIREFSYVYGNIMADSFATTGILIDMDEFARGFEDSFYGKTLDFDVTAQQEIIINFNHYIEDMMMLKGEENRLKGVTFLESKANEAGVITSETGLLYRIVEPGAERKPTAADTVTVHYKGTFIDGSEFDSSYSRGVPTSFPLSGVIAGWTEGLQYIGEGGSIELFIPSDLAYGQGNGSIPPNSVLIFEVELISIDTE